MAKRELSHGEVWDDSALVTSWNEALAEYKKYHSLAAQGERVSLVLDEAEDSSLEDEYVPEANAEQANIEQTEAATMNGSSAAPTNQAAAVNGISEASQQTAPHAVDTTAIPQALLNSVKDEGIKNIMMSWYYAGYYTGLYEGQQKAYASMQQAA